MWQKGVVVWVVALVVGGVAVGLAVEMVATVAFAVVVGVVVVWLGGLAGAVGVPAVLRWPRGWHRPQIRNWGRILRCRGRSYGSQGRCGRRS